MRIIAGKHRSRTILGPEDMTTRPILDRVKEALFNRLVMVIDIENTVVLDVFSGTGSMGLEALSRGARHVTFVERDRTARQRLAENLATLGETERARVLSVDALDVSWLERIDHEPVDLAFIDPPYAMMHDTDRAAKIAYLIAHIAPCSGPEAMLMLRTDSEARAPIVEPWGEARSHHYGSMTLHLYAQTG